MASEELRIGNKATRTKTKECLFSFSLLSYTRACLFLSRLKTKNINWRMEEPGCFLSWCAFSCIRLENRQTAFTYNKFSSVIKKTRWRRIMCACFFPRLEKKKNEKKKKSSWRYLHWRSQEAWRSIISLSNDEKNASRTTFSLSTARLLWLLFVKCLIENEDQGLLWCRHDRV